jgi:glycosyltransferase involved in cell wall biosynthesis
MVVFTGTVTRGKGIVTLFNAWPMVKQRFPMAELHLYGKDGSAPGERMKDFLINCVPKDLHDSVKFHGHVPRSELIRSLKAARVAVFPSFVEAFAMAPLESMACGCPTIYSKRGSGPEVIKDGIDGLLVDPGDASELAESIIAVMNNDDLAKRLSEQGRERVKRNFSLADLLIKNEALFDAVSRSFRKPLLGTNVPAKNGRRVS